MDLYLVICFYWLFYFISGQDDYDNNFDHVENVNCSVRQKLWPSTEYYSYCSLSFSNQISLTWNEAYNYCKKWSSELFWVASREEAIWLRNESQRISKNHSIDGLYLNLKRNISSTWWQWPDGELYDKNRTGKYLDILPWGEGQPDGKTLYYNCGNFWNSQSGWVLDDILCDSSEAGLSDCYLQAKEK